MSEARQPVDLLIAGAAQLATPHGTAPRGGRELGEVELLASGAVAVRGATIVAVGPETDIRRQYAAASELDTRGGLILPGFIDAHTHPVFAGTREAEFEMRTRGADYVEIARAGGGILSSVRGVRSASSEQLLGLLLGRLDRFLEQGTTTVECKTGYGLSARDELRSLEVLRAASDRHPIDIVPTFLGAHEYPEEYRENRSGWVDLLVGELLPEVAGRGLAEYCDVFTESHVFGLDDSRRILGRARELGLGLRLHVDQLTPLGGAELAAELGAASADHLEWGSDRGIEALARAGVVPVLCPLVPLYLRQEREVPGRRMIEAGLAPALSTDFNPGSCYTQSMELVLSIAALRLRMTAAECLTAATLNAACSLGRGERIGSLEPGKQADIVVLDVPDLQMLCYELGRPRTRAVIKAGQIVRGKAEAAC